ncbi:MAG: hypothetical protein PHC66_01335 [Candidatus Nanoarchaeia archaeon]|nr:hypothetical protein [Candidatus Nanoarchaeia archaeon]MDD5239137.1 hypothetical protein [Candidatus Nanoarchaeia archaeon]
MDPIYELKKIAYMPVKDYGFKPDTTAYTDKTGTQIIFKDN